MRLLSQDESFLGVFSWLWAIACLTRCWCLFWREQRVGAEAVLKRLQEHPDSWTRVDAILERSKSQQTKFFALQAGSPFFPN
jgi:exportin-1